MLLDFDCASDGWRAYDLAVLLWSTALRGMGDGVWELFAAASQARRPLLPAELAAVPRFVAARHL